MEEMIYTITLADGTVMDNLRLNGNNFVSDAEVTEDDFDGNLSEVTIVNGDHEQVMKNAELIQITHYSDGWYFILREIPADELEKRQMMAYIDYLSAMSGIDLPNEEDE